MELSEILSAVATVGFPAVMCILVWRQNRDLDERFTKLVENTTRAVAENSAALANLTGTIAELKNTIERG